MGELQKRCSRSNLHLQERILTSITLVNPVELNFCIVSKSLTRNILLVHTSLVWAIVLIICLVLILCLVLKTLNHNSPPGPTAYLSNHTFLKVIGRSTINPARIIDTNWNYPEQNWCHSVLNVKPGRTSLIHSRLRLDSNLIMNSAS